MWVCDDTVWGAWAGQPFNASSRSNCAPDGVFWQGQALSAAGRSFLSKFRAMFLSIHGTYRLTREDDLSTIRLIQSTALHDLAVTRICKTRGVGASLNQDQK
jgi:hypothetical protein